MGLFTGKPFQRGRFRTRLQFLRVCSSPVYWNWDTVHPCSPLQKNILCFVLCLFLFCLCCIYCLYTSLFCPRVCVLSLLLLLVVRNSLPQACGVFVFCILCIDLHVQLLSLITVLTFVIVTCIFLFGASTCMIH